MTSNSFSSERFVVVDVKFYPTNQKTEVWKGYARQLVAKFAGLR
jgi:hypothetical protein